MKNLRSFLVALTLVFASLTFVGCGSNNDDETTETVYETSEEKNATDKETTDKGVLEDIGDDVVTDIEDIGNDIESGADDIKDDMTDDAE